MKKVLTILIAFCLLVVIAGSAKATDDGCERVCEKYLWNYCISWAYKCPGPEGQQGETGPQGEQGDQGIQGRGSGSFKDNIMKAFSYGISAKLGTYETLGWIKYSYMSKWIPLIDLLGKYFATVDYVASLEQRIETLEDSCLPQVETVLQ